MADFKTADQFSDNNRCLSTSKNEYEIVQIYLSLILVYLLYQSLHSLIQSFTSYHHNGEIRLKSQAFIDYKHAMVISENCVLHSYFAILEQSCFMVFNQSGETKSMYGQING